MSNKSFNLKKLKQEAYDYFTRCKISPDGEDITSFVAEAIEGETGISFDTHQYYALGKKLGYNLPEPLKSELGK